MQRANSRISLANLLESEGRQRLYEEAVEYGDGTEASVEQMAHDVTSFLMWTAEPKLEARKGMGIGVMLFLLVFTGVLYAAKRKIWAELH